MVHAVCVKMPYCFVPGCIGGSSGQRKFYEDNNLPKLRFFQPPDEAAKKEWEELIKRDKPMKMTDKVCSAHFLEDDIKLHDEIVINGNIVSQPRERATLKPGALPLLCADLLDYNEPVIRKRSLSNFIESEDKCPDLAYSRLAGDMPKSKDQSRAPRRFGRTYKRRIKKERLPRPDTVFLSCPAELDTVVEGQQDVETGEFEQPSRDPLLLSAHPENTGTSAEVSASRWPHAGSDTLTSQQNQRSPPSRYGRTYKRTIESRTLPRSDSVFLLCMAKPDTFLQEGDGCS